MVVIVKLGGSFITDKTRPETILHDRLEMIAQELSTIPGPKIVIHGGGSFGHYYAKKYGIDNPLGISKTRLAMFRLSLTVCEHLDKHGLKPLIFPGHSHFIIRNVSGERVPTPVNMFPLEKALHRGNTPVTFGDITLELSKMGSKVTIISGDEIAYALVSYSAFRYASPRVFLISDTPGIFVRKNGPRIKRIDAFNGYYIDETGRRGAIEDIEFRDVGDATGGMRAKFSRAIRMALMGAKVFIGNSILDAMKGKGTIIE